MATTEVLHPILDLEASPIQGQVGSAVMDLDGRILQCGGAMSDASAVILYKVMAEVGVLKHNEIIERITVAFEGMQYVVTRDQTYVYAIQLEIP
mmetsp:Transcript_26103/g.38265  ORF Transcript_26103/g.38265 Transcript_26103/m.38265 type:complete len:94 (+) Transcript_26103:90-371(+)|eukprot:CAMPEP_0194054212 /NCGR_PEP_ID=MMETSP0009_2-20130614/52698_1 /TAXON_ID=210454 /ORGANISM="Grammatophora oceanica, Strain CCMP 410" /LENGTH=93 /DNA_ID=CAMNT_0038702623 /DNA_START=85 /DNA_END=366 /DNA_ORIENTATION=+